VDLSKAGRRITVAAGMTLQLGEDSPSAPPPLPLQTGTRVEARSGHTRHGWTHLSLLSHTGVCKTRLSQHMTTVPALQELVGLVWSFP